MTSFSQQSMDFRSTLEAGSNRISNLAGTALQMLTLLGSEGALLHIDSDRGADIVCLDGRAHV